MLLGLDTETALLLPGLAAPPLACGSFGWLEAGEIKHKVLSARETLDLVTKHLRDPSVTFVGHNIAYDLTVICAERPELIPLVFRAYATDRVRDTDMRERLIAIASGSFQDDRDVAYSLEALAKRRLGIALDKTTFRHGYGKLIDVPLDHWDAGAIKYAADDVRATVGVYLSQAEEVGDEYRAPHADHAVWHEPHACRKALALMLMRAWGVRVDAERVDELHRSLLVKERGLMVDLVAAGILEKHKKKDEYTAKKKRIQERIAVAYPFGLPMTDPSGRFPEGQIKTDAETCGESGDDLLEKYAAYVGVDKVIGTFLRPLLEAGGRPINPWWNPMVSSDRTSCSGPNFQNPPRAEGVRECIVPGAGQIFSSTDYATIELLALADFNEKTFGFSAMATRIRESVDLHTELASRLLGITYGEAKANKSRADVKNARNLAKAINFGFPGGLGAAKFVTMSKKGYGLIFTEDEARAYKSLYLDTNPEMPRFFDMVSMMTASGAALVEIPGSHMLRYCDGFGAYNKACNTHFQSPVAYGATDALFEVSRECYDSTRGSVLFGSRPTLFIHDEIICAHPQRIAHECALRVQIVMEAAMQKVLTSVPVKAEPCLMSRWSKGAEPLFNASGELIPWVKPAPTSAPIQATMQKAA